MIVTVQPKNATAFFRVKPKNAFENEKLLKVSIWRCLNDFFIFNQKYNSFFEFL